MTQRQLSLLLAWVGFTTALGLVANVLVQGNNNPNQHNRPPYLPKELLLVGVDNTKTLS